VLYCYKAGIFMKNILILFVALLLAIFSASCPLFDYYVTYSAGSSTAGTPPVDSNNYAYGSTVTVKDQGTLENPGFEFQGWRYSRRTYKPGDKLTISYDIEFVAAWNDGTDTDFIFDISGDEVIITGYNGGSYNSVTIPDTYRGKPVTRIENDAFFDKYIYGVTLNSSLKQIGSYSFYRCSIQQDLNIPDSVESIGVYAFYDNSIDVIKFGTGLTVINEGVFGKNSLKKVVLPDNIVSVKKGAFYDNNIVRITLGADVEIEDDNSFGKLGDLFKAYYEDNGRQAGNYGYGTDSWSLLED